MTALPHRVALLALGLALSLGACSSSKRSETNTSKGSVARVPVEAGGITVESVGKPVKLTDAQRDVVTIALSRYVTSATATPLQTGKLGTELPDVFDSAALAAATGTDKAALLDDGFPEGKVTIQPVTATINAVADASNQIALIAAKITVDASSTTDKGPVHVVRNATFIFGPDVNTWRIHSYDVTVTRDAPDSPTTTTKASR